jgi:hypothetical protein
MLKSVAALTGGLLSTPFLALAGETLRSEGSPIGLREIWTVPQHQLIVALGETIIPETDTPGATTARVDEFIGLMLGAWFMQNERAQFLADLDEFASRCVAETGVPFTSMSSTARTKYLEPLDRAVAEARLRTDTGGEPFGLLEGWRAGVDGGNPDGPVERRSDPLHFFATVKELTLVGYYTSEVGAASIGYFGPIGGRLGDHGPIGERVWN